MADEAKPKQQATYQVLKAVLNDGEPVMFAELGEPVVAASKNEAIRERAGKTAGSYKAVSTRTWAPTIHVRVRTEEVVDLSTDGDPEQADDEAPAVAGVGAPGNAETMPRVPGVPHEGDDPRDEIGEPELEPDGEEPVGTPHPPN